MQVINNIREPNWEALKPEQFEEFTFYLVRAMPFQEPRLMAGTGDRGEDIVAYQPAENPSIQALSRKWVFQCKRTKRLKKSEIKEELANFASKKIDTWVLVTTFAPSSAFKEWFDGLSKNYSNHYIQAWWRNDLNVFVRDYRHYLMDNLSLDIIRALNLQQYINLSKDSIVDNLIAKCRKFTNDQVERFAKNKYIKGLYIERGLQKNIDNFHAHEKDLSKMLKSNSSREISSVKLDLDRLVENFSIIDNIYNEIKDDLNSEKYIIKKRVLDKNNEVKHIPISWKPHNDIHKQLANSLINPIKDKIAELDSIIVAVRGLSDSRVYGQSDNHNSLKDLINNMCGGINEFIEKCRLEDKKQDITPIDNVSIITDWYIENKEPGNKRTLERAKREVSGILNSLRQNSDRLHRIVNRLDDCLKPCIVVIDRAGGGKTSLLCETATNKSITEPSILLFGKEYYSGDNSIINKILSVVEGIVEDSDHDPISYLDNVLEEQGIFLNIFIDGINENRRIPELDLCLSVFLNWCNSHRIRVTITCRDIYWSFFEYEEWRDYVFEYYRDQLYQFAILEYAKALPLYLEHYRLYCELTEDAYHACKHPLLLRFFCEAYGDPKGEYVDLGPIKDIRLKELFDEYYTRKIEQIRYFLRHKNADVVSRFILDIAFFLYKNTTTHVLTDEIYDATGHSDTSTESSLYLRLLDEDIVIEEDPTGNIESRKVYFVYEEFMEYVLAKAFLVKYKKTRKKTIFEIYDDLKMVSEEWVNARGVIEYFVLMLLGSNETKEKNEGYELLEHMTVSTNNWSDAFWSIVRKMPEPVINYRLYDLIYNGLKGVKNKTTIKSTVDSISRYSEKSGQLFSAALLLSSFLPNILKWTELSRLKDMSEEERTNLINKLSKLHKLGVKYSHIEAIKCDDILKWVIPHLEPNIKKRINKSIKLRGMPGERDFRRIIDIIRVLFPEQQVYLVNGLFHKDEAIARICGDRLRFDIYHTEFIIQLLSELSKYEKVYRTKKIIKDSIRWMVAHRQGGANAGRGGL